MTRIAIIDDHGLMREGIALILASDPSLELVLSTDQAAEILQKDNLYRWDVLIMDISMPELNGFELLEKILSTKPKARVLVLSMHNEAHFVLRMVRAGAMGYLTKGGSPSELLKAVKQVADGVMYLEESMAPKVLMQLRTTGPENAKLSERERQVLRLLVQGASTNEIANSLHVAASTVSTYKKKLREKLNADSDAEVLRYAIEFKLVD